MEHVERPKKVAIYMSAYNHEAYVAKTMESIIGQTYPHWELFVADDGSSDRTAEIIASYQDERIHFYPLKENTQLVGAWEMLMDIIRPLEFDYMQSMASDDYWDIHKLEKQVAFLEAHPQYAACFSWAETIDGQGKVDTSDDMFNLDSYSRYEWLQRLFTDGNMINCNSALVRRDVYFEAGTMNQRFIIVADFRLWYRIVSNYPVYLMREKLIYYRRHDKNLSNMSLQSAVCFMEESARVMEEVLRPMDAYTFRRAHYPLLAYRTYATEAELLAAKFILLVNGLWSDKSQVAIELYYDHIDDREFLRVLREQYGFDGKDFTRLKENNGLAYAVNDIAKRSGMKDYIPQELPQTYAAWELLFRDVQNENFSQERACRYTYAVIRQLQSLQGDNKDINDICTLVFSMCRKMRENRRKDLGSRKVLFLVASDSDWRLNKDNTPVLPDDKTEYYVAYINPTDVLQAVDIRALVEEDIAAGTDLDSIQYIDLFDEDNQALLFADDVIEDLTDICYVDCLDDAYECRRMTDGYPVDINQLAILEKTKYEQILRQDAASLKMLEGVYFY